jgi:hypothetical protein
LVGFDKFDIDLGLNGAIAQVHPLLSYWSPLPIKISLVRESKG